MRCTKCWCEAARRGVQVDLTIDGYGSPDLSPQFISSLTDAGVRVHVFDPRPEAVGLSHEPVSPHAPQDRRRRRRVGVRRRHQLFGRPPGRLRAAGQAGPCGRDRRARWSPRSSSFARDSLASAAQPHRRWFRRHAACAAAAGAAPPPAARTRCSSRATTPNTATTSSATTASRSARRASACGSRSRISFPATGCCTNCARRRGAASTCG